MRDRQSAKELYDSLLKRYEDAQLAQSMEAANQGERFQFSSQRVAMGQRAKPLSPARHGPPCSPPCSPASPCSFANSSIRRSIAWMLCGSSQTFQYSPPIPSIEMPASKRLPRALGVTACVIGGLALVAAFSAYVAIGNEQLVRFLVRGA